MADTIFEFINNYQQGIEDSKSTSVLPSVRKDGVTSGISVSNAGDEKGYDESKLYPWIPTFEGITENLLSIASNPRTHIKVLKEVKITEKAVKIDNVDINMTVKVPKFWKHRGNKPYPEKVYSDDPEIDLAIYENRFLVALADKMMVFISAAIAEFYSKIRFLTQYVHDGEIDFTDIKEIQTGAEMLPLVSGEEKDFSILSKSNSPVIATLKKLFAIRNSLSFFMSTELTKAVRKVKPLSDTDIHSTNLLLGDSNYSPCFRFYFELINLLSEQRKKEQILEKGYANYVLELIVRSIRKQGFRPSATSIPLNDKKELDFRNYSLSKGAVKITFVSDVTDMHYFMNITVDKDLASVSEEDYIKQKYESVVSLDIVPGLNRDYPSSDILRDHILNLYSRRASENKGISNIFILTSVPEVKTRGVILCNPTFGRIDSNIDNMVRMCLTFIEADRWLYSRICPVCGSFVDGEGTDGHCYCSSCDSSYVIFDSKKNGKAKSTVWIKRLSNGNAHNLNNDLYFKLLISNADIDGDVVSLRPLSSDDLDALFALTNVSGVLEMMGGHRTETKDACEKLLNHYIESGYRAIIRNKDNKLVGVIGLSYRKLAGYFRFISYKVEFFIGEKYWGHGYAAEAVSLASRYAFNEGRADLIWAEVGDFDKAALKVLYRNRFLFVDSNEDNKHGEIQEASRLITAVLFNETPFMTADGGSLPSAPHKLPISELTSELFVDDILSDEITDEELEETMEKQLEEEKNEEALHEAEIAEFEKERLEEEEALAKKNALKEEADKKKEEEPVAKPVKVKQEKPKPAYKPISKPVEPKPAPAPVAPAPVVPTKPKKEKERAKLVDFGPGMTDDRFSTIHTLSTQDKLAALTREGKEDYDAIKKYILSYGAKAYMTNSYEAFRVNKRTILALSIGGVHIRLNGAINPKVFEHTRIPVNDDSKVKKYQDVPAFMKIISDKTYRLAFRFVDEVMKANKVKKK